MTNPYIINQVGEKFTFQPGMISNIKTTITPAVEQIQIPSGGPMQNQGINIDGCGKTINITGRFLDNTTASVTSDGSNDIRSKEMMKAWFEAIPVGFTALVEIYTYLNEKSVSLSNISGVEFGTDAISGGTITLPATFVNTKGYVTGFDYEESEGVVEEIPFTLSLWIAGL